MRWVLITGAAKNLGRCLTRSLVGLGYGVAVHYRTSEKEAKELADEFGNQVQIFQGDFSTPAGVEQFIKSYQSANLQTHALINNVGNFHQGPFLTMDPSQWRELFQVNVHAPQALIQALFPMLKKNLGSIINIGVAGLCSGRVDLQSPAYHITKKALWAMTLASAKESAELGVRVNMISPGYLETSLGKRPHLPMGEPVLFEEISNVVEYILSEKNRSITGQNIEVAGALRL